MTYERVIPVIIERVETCCVADQMCDAPANLDPLRPAKAECYICGQKVCTKCSSRRYYPAAREVVRACLTASSKDDAISCVLDIRNSATLEVLR